MKFQFFPAFFIGQRAKELIVIDVYGDNTQLITDSTEALDKFIQELIF